MEVRDQLTVILVEQIEEVPLAAVNQDIPSAPLAERDELFARSTAS